MEVGDIVKTTGDGSHGSSPRDWVGVIVEIFYHEVKHPDYRTPVQLRVFFPERERVEWCYKQEVEVIK